MRPEIKDNILGFVLLGVLGTVGWFVFTWFLDVFWSVDKSIQAALIGAVVALISILFTFWKERSRAIREAHREKKIEVYSSFFDMIFEIIHRSIQGREKSKYLESESFIKAMIEFKKNMLVYGSPDVIKAFNKFQEDSVKNGDNQRSLIETLKTIGNIFLAIRKDIGLSNSGLTVADLHKLYVTDYDEQVRNEEKK